MNSEKLENVLNLALDTPEAERERSSVLQVGYDTVQRKWDLIVRYVGSITFLQEWGIDVVILANQYAILTVPENQIDELTALKEIIYIEKPKRLYFAIQEGKRISCINPVQNPQLPNQLNLYGKGTIIAVIDSGIDYAHPAFRNADGTTRILELWDQTIPGNPPEGYVLGTVYTREEINRALQESNLERRYAIVPSRDISGHGTHVTGIAAGNFAEDRNQNLGIATQSELIIVKLGTPKPDSFPRTSELMQALDYVVKRGAAYNRPLAVNLSFGNTYGSHDGESLLATFMDGISNIGRNVIVVGTGNEGLTRGHAREFLQKGTVFSNPYTDIELNVAEYTPSLNIQLWKQYVDQFLVTLYTPGGEQIGPLTAFSETVRYVVAGGSTIVLSYYGKPQPYSVFQEIFLDFIPQRDYIAAGIWRIRLTPGNIVSGQVDLWLPAGAALTNRTGFLNPSPETTLTIPSATENVISVGAYDGATNAYANFSGRGFTRLGNRVKPDLTAPGVNIRSAAVGGGTEVRTGTSMATPFVTGSAALLMEWGEVLGNDPYLYGEKVKAYLIRGAKRLPAYTVYPNPEIGWGALCLRDSIPGGSD